MKLATALRYHELLTSRSFFLFAAYYFTKFFHFRPAPFHEQFYEDFEALVLVD